MRKTEHYSLNQWDLEDEIRMEDFNRDNAALDAALHALGASGAEPLWVLTNEGNSVSFGGPMPPSPGIGGKWEDWNIIVYVRQMEALNPSDASRPMVIRFQHDYASQVTLPSVGSFMVVLFPMGRPDSTVRALIVADNTVRFVTANIPYSQLTYVFNDCPDDSFTTRGRGSMVYGIR